MNKELTVLVGKLNFKFEDDLRKALGCEFDTGMGVDGRELFISKASFNEKIAVKVAKRHGMCISY